MNYSEKAQQRIEAAIIEAQKNRAWYGTFMLFKREMMRFISIFGQTVISPVLSTLLFFLVFGYSLGGSIDNIQGVEYIDFIVPGLVMMSVITNAYFNSAFSFFIGKVHGTIVDLLASPISSFQILLAFSASSIIRGCLTGGLIWLIAGLMGANTLHNPALSILFMVLACFVFGLLGLAMAILATEFEHVNFIPSFVMMPLTFLGGVFYSITLLPEPWQTISHINPVLYIISGIREGMIGISDVPYWQGLLILFVSSAGLLAYTYYLLHSGKKLRE